MKKVSPIREVKNLYKAILKLREDDLWIVDFILGMVAANMLGEEQTPVWGYICGPSGCGKTECILPLQGLEYIKWVDTLTENTLFSGFVEYDEEGEQTDKDYSLVPKLDGKVVLMPDFTTFMSLPQRVSTRIMGELRGIFDDRTFVKETGVSSRSYDARFGLLACVTPELDEFLARHTALGQRALTFRMWRGGFDRVKVLDWIMLRSGSKKAWRKELREAVHKVMERYEGTKRTTFGPVKSKEVRKQFGAMANMTVLCRTVPDWRGRTKDPEVGSRLVEQVKNLCTARQMIEGRVSWNEEDIALARRLCLDTMPSDTQRLLKALWKQTSGKTPLELSRLSRIPPDRVGHFLGQWHQSGMIERAGGGWRLTTGKEGSRTYVGQAKFF